MIKHMLVNIFCSITMILLFPVKGISALLFQWGFLYKLNMFKGKKKLRSSNDRAYPPGKNKKYSKIKIKLDVRIGVADFFFPAKHIFHLFVEIHDYYMIYVADFYTSQYRMLQNLSHWFQTVFGHSQLV